ncbi:MAG: hypothetical protein L0Z62_12565 [Gemmataceae bacterium]|nr:hypothetical protein [Gemmataceae bacterium]
MPQPFDALTPAEQGLYDALRGEPLAPYLPSLLADHADDNGKDYRAELLRHFPRAALYELLRNRALTDEECAQAVRDPGGDTARRVSALLGVPRQQLPDLRTPEGVRQQYDFQRTLLASLGLLELHDGQTGITAIDGQFYPLPALPQIEAALSTKRLQQKIAQGFDQLLLVPFGLTLGSLLDAWRGALRRNEHLLEVYGGLDREQTSVWVWKGGYGPRDGQGPDEDGRLVYFPQRFAPDHGGQTRGMLLAADRGGFDIVLVEGALAEIPLRGQGRTLAGRAQVETGRMPQEYLVSLPAGEVGWTPEIYIAASLTSLERGGRPLDAETLTYLTGAYLPAPGNVPSAYWSSDGRQAYLGRVVPANSNLCGGARAAVRVV